MLSSLQKIAFHPVGQYFCGYLRGSGCFPVRDGHTQRKRPWGSSELSSCYRFSSRAQVSEVSGFVQPHAAADQWQPRKKPPFLVSQCWALKKRRTGHLIAVAGRWHSMGVCRACWLGSSYYSLVPLSWTLLNPPCLCPGKSDKGAFDFSAALCMQHSEKRGWQWGWEEEKTFVFQYWPDMKAPLRGILRTQLNNGHSQDKR